MDTLQKTLKKLPHSPGVYIYKDTSGTVIYVGKARNLYERVHTYFGPQSELSEKTKQLVSHIHALSFRQVSTEFEALLLESKLIRFYAPKYNSIAKDDKSPIYIYFQDIHNLPIVQLSRKSKIHKGVEEDYYGPFPSKKVALRLIRALRHSIPFCQQKKRNGTPCFYTHLGLCKPCPSVIQRMPEGEEKKNMMRTYKANITRLRWILSGYSRKAIQSMQKEMYALSKKQKFEHAQTIRDQINALTRIIQTRYDPFIFEETDRLEKIPEELTKSLLMFLKPYYPELDTLERIECFDMSTFHGVDSVGSMIVFSSGIPEYDQYRRFKIRWEKVRSDVSMMEEVIERRLKHTEWTYPNLFVVDGGKPQVHTISNLLEKKGVHIPLIGLAKRFEQIIIKKGKTNECIVKTIPLSSPTLQLLQHMRDEAHRFAISYHKKLRTMEFAEKHTHLV